MSEQRWFSSKVRMICLIEPEGGHHYMDSVIVFQSTDFDSAFTKALEIGRKREEIYLNDENHQVVWKLKEIISLDVIDFGTLDGVEVYSESVGLNLGELIPFNTEFHPEQSQPTQSI
jgi:hypothetical protein